MAKPDLCPLCGLNMVLVGLQHICRPERLRVAAAMAASRPVEVGKAPSVSHGTKRRVMPPPMEVLAGPVLEVVDRETGRPVEVLEQHITGAGSGSTSVLEIKRLGLSREMWGRIDAYWHRRGLGSRTAAVRELIERGLK